MPQHWLLLCTVVCAIEMQWHKQQQRHSVKKGVCYLDDSQQLHVQKCDQGAKKECRGAGEGGGVVQALPSVWPLVLQVYLGNWPSGALATTVHAQYLPYCLEQ